MAEKKTITIKAAADAPDVVSIGNLIAEKKNGAYHTDDPKFAEHLESFYGNKSETPAGEAVAAVIDEEPATDETDPKQAAKKKSGGEK